MPGFEPGIKESKSLVLPNYTTRQYCLALVGIAPTTYGL